MEKPEITLSVEAKAIKLGFYEHYKQTKYEFIGVAHHSETLEELVIYRALYGEELFWARPISEFIGTVELNGQTVPRFRYLGPKNT